MKENRFWQIVESHIPTVVRPSVPVAVLIASASTGYLYVEAMNDPSPMIEVVSKIAIAFAMAIMVVDGVARRHKELSEDEEKTV